MSWCAVDVRSPGDTRDVVISNILRSVNPALCDAGFDVLDEVVDDAWWGAAGRRADAACER